MMDEKAKKAFRETVGNYDPHASLDTNMSKLMAMAHNQIQRNSEEINRKLQEEEENNKKKQEELEIQKKKEKLARLRAKARKYLYV